MAFNDLREANNKLEEYEKLWNKANEEFPFILETLNKVENTFTPHNPLKKDFKESLENLKYFWKELKIVW